jgi:hypothetical protein
MVSPAILAREAPERAIRHMAAGIPSGVTLPEAEGPAVAEALGAAVPEEVAPASPLRLSVASSTCET